MPKVYFRAVDGKAFSKEIAGEVDYTKVLESISKTFKLSKENIKLVYNGETRTGNFKLNSDIPHHIIHIVDKSKVGHEQINVNLTINNGKHTRKIENIKTKSNTPVKDFINSLFETNTIKKDKVDVGSTELFHHGVKLNGEDTFIEKGVENNANINVMLRDDWPDPSDIQECATRLSYTVDPLIMGLQMNPKYYTLATQINQLKTANFFKHFQQRYEGNRVSVIYTDYEAYRFPTSPTAEGEEEEATQ